MLTQRVFCMWLFSQQVGAAETATSSQRAVRMLNYGLTPNKEITKKHFEKAVLDVKLNADRVCSSTTSRLALARISLSVAMASSSRAHSTHISAVVPWCGYVCAW